MKICNIVIKDRCATKYFIDCNAGHQLAHEVQRINYLFKFNATVILEFAVSSQILCSNDVYPDAEAAARDCTIYIFTDKVRDSNLIKLIVHEYVHVCIAKTFSSPCPLWLNEGLAVYLSGQGEDIEPICPVNIKTFYISDQSAPHFYNMALFTVRELIKKMSLYQLIETARNCQSFLDNHLLGLYSIESIAAVRTML